VSSGQRIEYHQLELSGACQVVCNLYVIPEGVWHRDVGELAYGGFYAHKVALSFDELYACGDVIDPAREFWTAESRRLGAGRSVGTPESLMRAVHGRILAFQPTFLRSLAKFVRSPSRMRGLVSWLSERIDSFSGAQRSSIGDSEAFARNCERAPWLYWSEYERHKGRGTGWSRRTIEKMQLCLDPADLDAVEEYLNGPEHPCLRL
jgi:hypothetical protein